MEFWDYSTWWTFYRMVTYNPQTGQYHLTGVAQWKGEANSAFTVPWDSEKAIFEIPEVDDPQFVSPEFVGISWEDVPKGPKNDQRLMGYMIHALCWRLMQMCLGRDLERKTSLEALTRALHTDDDIIFTYEDAISISDMMEFKGYPTKSKLIRSLIRQAKEESVRKRPRLRVSPRRMPVVSQLEHLPAEIQYAIMDYLV